MEGGQNGSASEITNEGFQDVWSVATWPPQALECRFQNEHGLQGFPEQVWPLSILAASYALEPGRQANKTRMVCSSAQSV